MAELKTKKTNKSVSQFIKAIDDPERRKDCETLAKLMKKIIGKEPKMWGEGYRRFRGLPLQVCEWS